MTIQLYAIKTQGAKRWEVYNDNGKARIVRYVDKVEQADWTSPDRTAEEWVAIQRPKGWIIVR